MSTPRATGGRIIDMRIMAVAYAALQARWATWADGDLPPASSLSWQPTLPELYATRLPLLHSRRSTNLRYQPGKYRTASMFRGLALDAVRSGVAARTMARQTP